MNILGLKIRGHDTGAAVIGNNNRIVATAEERLNRIKHSFDIFPILSIQYCMKELSITERDVDMVVIDQVSHRLEVKMEEIFHRETKGAFVKAKVYVINHHDAHAASAFFASPFTEAAVLVYDGSGEKFIGKDGVPRVETETLYRGSGNKLTELKKTTHERRGKEFVSTWGIGKLYSFLSSFYLGFGAYNEGKMMGLAPYGDSTLLEEFPEGRWFIEKDGEVLVNSRITFPRGKSREKGEDRRSILTRIKGRFRRMFHGKHTLVASPFTPIRLPQPKRKESDVLPDKYYAGVARAAQTLLESVAIRWGKILRSLTGLDAICIAGGVGLNIDANLNFLTKVGFKDIFVQPAASDTGIALGAALYGAHVIADVPRFYEMKSASLGRSYSNEEIESVLLEEKGISFQKFDTIAKEAAKLIADGKIIGWFQGGAEYGPRALGNRSILADARRPDMKDILNARVKHREEWRPFAASVLAEKNKEYFDITHDSPFMLLAAPVRENRRKEVPSIVHVDGSCRIQSVTKEQNSMYYELLSEFNTLTKTPLVLNTSFNLGGDPIVETPADALKTFLATDFDALVIGNYCVTKS